MHGVSPLSRSSDARAAPRYRLVIFDFDGTLADSGDWFLSIANDLADRFKFQRVHPDEVEQLRGKTSRQVIKQLGIPRWKLPRIGRYVHELLATQTDRISLFPGINDVLARLSAEGVALALVTSNSEGNARAILGPENAALFSWLECGASLFGKARSYKRVLKRSGMEREDVISFGDETRDISAARKAGIASGAVLWGYANREALASKRPDLFLEKPADVLTIVLGQAATLPA